MRQMGKLSSNNIHILKRIQNFCYTINMKTTKTNIAFIIGIIVLSGLIIWAYISMTAKKTPPPVSCAIGDKYDIMTGDICFPHYEEEEPATTTPIDYTRG